MKKNKHANKKLLKNKNQTDQSKPQKSSNTTLQLSKKNGVAKKKTSVGPFITATFTAILIGLFLGLMMLNMFTNKDDQVSTKETPASAAQMDTDERNDPDQSDAVELKPTTLKQIHAHVLQLGVFSEQENANDWSETYQQLGFPSIHFQRDDQYYLFAGMAETKERAKEFATTLLENDIEVYVKEWTTSEIEVELTEEESEWLKLFQEEWEQTLQSLEKQEEISLNDWKNLTENESLNSERLTQLVQAIQFISENEVENSFELQNYLLNIWKVYEEVFF